MTKPKSSKRTMVMVRTYSAGVHVGELVARKGTEVELANAKRVWRWTGANTLNELSQSGPGSGSRVSVAVPTLVLTEAIEVLGLSDTATAAFARAGWGS